MANSLFEKQDVLNLLKPLFHEDLISDLQRESPFGKMVSTKKLEGESYSYGAVYSASPACSSSYITASRLAAETGQVAVWKVDYRQYFAAFTCSTKEFAAAITRKGSYNTIVGTKVFQVLVGLRKHLACLNWGDGTGRFLRYTGPDVAVTAGTDFTFNATSTATISIVAGSEFRVIKGGVLLTAANISTDVIPAVAGVSPVDNGIKVKFSDENASGQYVITANSPTSFTLEDGDTLHYEGAIDPDQSANGYFNVPDGYRSWVLDRSDPNYAAKISQPLRGVVIANAPSALGGQWYQETDANAKIYDSVLKLMRKCRRGGGTPDHIFMNDEDRANADIQYEIARTQFLQHQSTTKGAVNRGYGNSATFALWTSIIDKLIDDPYLEKGYFAVMELKAAMFIYFTNIDRVHTNAFESEDPGRSDPMSEENADYGKNGDKLMLDDIVDIDIPGDKVRTGAVKLPSFNLIYNFMMLNTAGSGLGKLYQ